MPRGYSRAVGARETGPGGFVEIDFGGVSQLARGFADLPAATKRELRPKVLEAAELVAGKARSNASSAGLDWIPGAIKVKAPLGVASVAQVFVDSSQAPAGHEPLPRLEEFGVPFFRHPVFGNTENWVSQEGHPFLFPAVQSESGHVVELLDEAIRSAAASVGLI